MSVFEVGIGFQSYMDCMEFSEKPIPASQFKLFIYIVSYLQFLTVKTMLTTKSQQDGVHAANVQNKKE